MGVSTTPSPEQRQIRVFLSSTFVDFLEERELLTKRVFPALNRRARDRGVELVDVDLRWGVTEEQTRQGQTLPLCLGEIDRCRPYFIGLLGERHGWVPPAEFYRPELLERQPWLKQHQGGASVTELEILHGVLRNPEMAGYARFYLRDPAYALAQQDPAWLAQGEGEHQRLEALKQQVRASGFPVVEGLADPEAIANRIEADLWQLIEERFPEQEPPDALAREELKHASYRQARLGVYLDAAGNMQKLEDLIASGEQQILITGESGSGKSALIANWMQRHHQLHPQDHIHAHHLGCTNDSNAIRPLLARLIETASGLLEGKGLISEPVKIPQDWWDLVARVAETLQDLGRWARTSNCRWILVLDGLDRLPAEDQNALPWLPPTIPVGVQVVVTALDCPARTILQQRGVSSIEIGPLQRSEQLGLIKGYLGRYTKQLEAGLQEQILSHRLAGSPLFLLVLLEELRKCGCHDTLTIQLDFYLGSQTISDLYERVLERLENDGSGDTVRKVMTAIWASRAGLTESELLEITDLAPLHWAPIDLALEKAFGYSYNRLRLGNIYLQNAVESRWLPTDKAKKRAHSDLADWHEGREEWDERISEELPWQLLEADRLEDLREYLLAPSILASLEWDCGSQEVISYWNHARMIADGELDDLISFELSEEIERRRDDAESLGWLIDRVAEVLTKAGLYRELLLNLRSLSLDLAEASVFKDEETRVRRLSLLADAHRGIGNYDTAALFYQRCLEALEDLFGANHPRTLTTLNNLASVLLVQGDYSSALPLYKRCLEAKEKMLGSKHPSTTATIGNIGHLYMLAGNLDQAEALSVRAVKDSTEAVGESHPFTLTHASNLGILYIHLAKFEEAEARLRRCLELSCSILGYDHPGTNDALVNLAGLLKEKGDHLEAQALFELALEVDERLFGFDHPSTIITARNLADVLREKGDSNQAELLYKRCLETSEWLQGPEHPCTLAIVENLGLLYADKCDYDQAEAFYKRKLEASERRLGSEHPSILITLGNLGRLYSRKGDYEQAEGCLKRALNAQERLLGPEHSDTLMTIDNLGMLYSDRGDYKKAVAVLKRAMEAKQRLLGPQHPQTLGTISNLGLIYSYKGDFAEAETLLERALEAKQRLLGAEHPETLHTINNLGLLYSSKGDYEKAITFYKHSLEAKQRLLGTEHPDTLITLGNIGLDYYYMGDYEQAESFLKRAFEAQQRLLGVKHPETLMTINNIGLLYFDKGDYPHAEELLKLALDVSELLLGPEHPSTLITVGNMGRLFSAKGDFQQAEVYLKRALDTSEMVLGVEHPSTLIAVGNLAGLYRRKGDYEQADIFYTRCLDGQERLLGPEHPVTLRYCHDFARVLSGLNRHAEAISLRRRELAWRRQRHGDTDHGTLTSINQLAIDLRETGELEEAETLFRELVVNRQQVLQPGDFEIGCAMGGLAHTLEQAGKLNEALVYRQQALAHRLEYEGSDACWTNRGRLDLARLLHKLNRHSEASALLQELQLSMGRIDDPGEEDQQLIREATDLLRMVDEAIRSGP